MNFEILELKKDNIENTTSNNIRVSKIVINKFYCSGCETYFKVIRDHLIKYHKPKQDPRNKGNIKCDLCDVYVKDYYSHTFSKLHRFNLDINSIDYMCDVDDFLKHFDKYIKDP